MSAASHRECDMQPEVARFARNFLAEEDSAALYEALATLERDPRQKELFRSLAGSERAHGEYWRMRLRNGGHAVPKHSVSPRTRLLIHLARWLGSEFVLPAIAIRERNDHEDYAGQKDAAQAGLALEERSHAQMLRAMTGAAVGTNLRAAVLGANDGLSSNFSLMMGVIGAGAAGSTVVLTGIAGLVAGASSMALGEWLSVTNARELTESLMDRDVCRPGENAAVDRPVARACGEAWGAARFSFCLFALGAAVPLLPFALSGARLAIAGSVALSIAALAVFGLATSLFNGRSAAFSAARQVGIGTAAALATYGVGWLAALVRG